MITPGRLYLQYLGFPEDDERYNTLANQISDAMLEAAEDVLKEHGINPNDYDGA